VIQSSRGWIFTHGLDVKTQNLPRSGDLTKHRF
jgi:hypothetical protein